MSTTFKEVLERTIWIIMDYYKGLYTDISLRRNHRRFHPLYTSISHETGSVFFTMGNGSCNYLQPTTVCYCMNTSLPCMYSVYASVFLCITLHYTNT